MTIEQFTNKADGIINDFTGGISDEKEFRDNILDLLIEVAKKAIPIEPPVKPANGGSREDKIMELLQDFWEEHNNNKAVVWIRNDNTGQLAVYTRGEYAKDLIQFISHLY